MSKNTWPQSFGVKVLKSFFSSSQIEEVLLTIKKLEEQADRKDYIWKYYDNNSATLSRIEYFINYDYGLRQLSSLPNILTEVSVLMGEPVVLFKDKINFKYPGSEGFVPHQDISAGWGNYCSKHITVAIPLSDTTIDNGCIYFGPRHTTQLTDMFEDLNDDVQLSPISTEKGDIILFDSYVPHASYSNNSKDPRCILFFTYTPASCGSFYEAYHADKFKNVPPDIHKIKGKKYRSGNSNSIETTY